MNPSGKESRGPKYPRAALAIKIASALVMAGCIAGMAGLIYWAANRSPGKNGGQDRTAAASPSDPRARPPAGNEGGDPTAGVDSGEDTGEDGAENEKEWSPDQSLAPEVRRAQLKAWSMMKMARNFLSEARSSLDEGNYDLAGLLDTLDELGFRGQVGLQGFGLKIEAREHLARSMSAWRALQTRGRRD